MHRGTDDETADPRDHGRAASETALLVLETLWHHGPARVGQLHQRLGVPVDHLTQALRGLDARDRVYCEGKGHHAFWCLKHGSKREQPT